MIGGQMLEGSIMDYVKLGSTGMKVSRLCLGCMSFGTPGWEVHPWVMDEKSSQSYLLEAFDSGINFFDTADFYSKGASEEILGNFISRNISRHEVVVASKIGLSMGDGANNIGLSRKHILEAVDASLKRLKTDYIDLLYIHRLDPDTSMEEVVEVLDDIVKSGKATYIGASSMWTWQFVKMREMQKANGLAQFVAMQNFYNLVYREEEREMIPYCKSEGVALVPWSPMARGFLAGSQSKTSRGETDKMRAGYFGSKADHAVLKRVEKIAENLSVKPAQIALAWTLAKGITAPIIGTTKPHHLSDALAALDIILDQKTLKSLAAPYVTRPVMGHS